MKEIDKSKKVTDIVMFDGASNVQLSGRLLRVHDPKLTVMRCVENTVSLFLMMFQIYPSKKYHIYSCFISCELWYITCTRDRKSVVYR